jgi:hypothetical protein
VSLGLVSRDLVSLGFGSLGLVSKTTLMEGETAGHLLSTLERSDATILSPSVDNSHHSRLITREALSPPTGNGRTQQDARCRITAFYASICLFQPFSMRQS